MSLEQSLSRRKALQLMVALGEQTLVATTFTSIYMAERDKRKRNNNITISSQTRAPLTRSWNDFDALTRINLLELDQVPDGLDLNQEIATAVAQRFTQRVSVKQTPQELAQAVAFISGEEYLQVEIDAALAQGYNPAAEDIEKYKNQLAKTLLDSKRVYVNLDQLSWFASVYSTHFPENATRLQGRNLETFLKKSVLFHEFGHLIQSNEEFPIEDYALTGSDGFITFDRFKGFLFTGRTNTGRSYYLNGSAEASTEAVAIHAAQGSGEHYSQFYYNEGAKIIAELNRMSNIDSQAFNRYFNGNNNAQDLFRRWGRIHMPRNQNTVQGRNALIFIGLGVDQKITFDQTISLINQTLVTP